MSAPLLGRYQPDFLVGHEHDGPVSRLTTAPKDVVQDEALGGGRGGMGQGLSSRLWL